MKRKKKKNVAHTTLALNARDRNVQLAVWSATLLFPRGRKRGADGEPGRRRRRASRTRRLPVPTVRQKRPIHVCVKALKTRASPKRSFFFFPPYSVFFFRITRIYNFYLFLFFFFFLFEIVSVHTRRSTVIDGYWELIRNNIAIAAAVGLMTFRTFRSCTRGAPDVSLIFSSVLQCLFTRSRFHRPSILFLIVRDVWVPPIRRRGNVRRGDGDEISNLRENTRFKSEHFEYNAENMMFLPLFIILF